MRGDLAHFCRTVLAVSFSLVTPFSMLWADETNAFELFQEEAKVTIATRHEQSTEEAPSIVSVITRREIEAYGDRELSDILRRVPGFEFGVDVYSEAGLTFRGIWAEEGKSLLMIDGVMQNELGFGNYNFFASIPASIIEKVEIIRGPGSALYGGFAEVDVINVITRRPKNLNGMRVTGDIGVVGHGAISRSGNISYGSETDALKVAAHVGYGSTVLSRRDYTDFFGNRLNQNQDTSPRNWQHIITEASSKNLTIRYQRTDFTFGAQDTFTTIQPPVNGNNLERTNNYNDVFHLDYKQPLGDHLSLQPLFEYTRNNTWSAVYPASSEGLFEGSGVSLWRTRGEMTAVYETPWTSQLRFGGGYLQDGVNAVAANGTPGLFASADPNDLTSRQTTASAFGLFQYEQQLQAVGLTAGCRYDDTTFGHAFAPRAGVTYVHDAFNAKVLYGRAFRIPLPWQAYSRNLVFNDSLKPETADTTELELGYKFTPHISGKINTFFIDINDPIIYQGAINSYTNFGRIQSEGVESELRADYGQFGGYTNVSYATPGPNTSPQLTTPGKKQFLGSPPVKINFGTFYRSGRMEYAPSATYLSPRAAQTTASANDPGTPLETTNQHALFLANLNITAHDVLKDVDIHLAVHNIFDARYTLIQPFYGDHAPIPAQDREIDLGITWHL